MKHLPLVAAVALSSAVCASAAYWASQWFQPPPWTVAAAPQAAPAPPDVAAAGGLFGGAPAGPVATLFQLKGVIEAGPEGVAILAAEGKPAQAVGVGKEVAPGVTVTEIHQRYVLLDEGGAVKRLELPDNAIAGLQLVAAVAATPSGMSKPAAPARAPPQVFQSGGAMPMPPVDPDQGKTPGHMPDQQMQMMQHMQHMEEMQRIRRSGIGPAAAGAQPTT